MQHHQLTEASHYNMKLFINCLLCLTQLSSFHYLFYRISVSGEQSVDSHSRCCLFGFCLLFLLSFFRIFFCLSTHHQQWTTLLYTVCLTVAFHLPNYFTLDWCAPFSLTNKHRRHDRRRHHRPYQVDPFCTEYSIHILFGRSSMPNKSKWGKRHIIGTAVTSAVCHDSD